MCYDERLAITTDLLKIYNRLDMDIAKVQQ
jgi:hypothetical protein